MEALDINLGHEDPNLGRVIVNPSSEEGKELAKWEHLGEAARKRHDRYPKMVYRAQERPDGIMSVGESDDSLFLDGAGHIQAGAAERWSARCQLVVNDEEEHRKALDRGWRDSHEDAMNRARERHEALAEAAANRAHGEQWMSDAAKREAAQAEAQSDSHLAAIPEKRRARRTKSKAGSRPKAGRRPKPKAQPSPQDPETPPAA